MLEEWKAHDLEAWCVAFSKAEVRLLPTETSSLFSYTWRRYACMHAYRPVLQCLIWYECWSTATSLVPHTIDINIVSYIESNAAESRLQWGRRFMLQGMGHTANRSVTRSISGNSPNIFRYWYDVMGGPLGGCLTIIYHISY